MLKKFGSSSGSCGSGKLFGGHGAGAPTTRPSYFNDVLRKLRGVEQLQGLSEEEIEAMVGELTDMEQMWSVHFSGVVLDPARECIEKNLVVKSEADGVNATPLEGGLPTKFIKLLCRCVRDGSQYGVQSFSSLLLAHYGPIRASILVGGAVVLEWGASGLVIPSRKPLQPAVGSMQSAFRSVACKVAVNATDSPGPEQQITTTTPEEEILHEFETTLAKKEQVDKLIDVVVRYNKSYFYHPILRNCQKFAFDCLSALGQPIHPKLEGTLSDYLKEVKKGRKRKLNFESHVDLDAYVDRVLESGGTTVLESEYLLAQYFSFHVMSMTDSDKPERWTCGVTGCHMPDLEQSIDLKNTLAYHMFSSGH